MCQDEEPYAVPINHAYTDGKLYFHCGLAGRKLDMIRANPNVCYVVNKYFGDTSDLKDDIKCHGDWESVIVYGKARVLDDPEETSAAFSSFMKFYGTIDYKPSEETLQRTKAIVIEVESMTARRETKQAEPDKKAKVEYWSWNKT